MNDGAIQGMEKFEMEKATHLYTRMKLLWVVIPDGAKQYEAGISRKH